MDKRMKYLIIGALATGLTMAGAVSGGLMQMPFTSVDMSMATNGLAIDQPVHAQFAANSQIEAPVATGFGTYTPYPIPTYRPMVGLNEPTISSGFANVATLSRSFPWNRYFDAKQQVYLRDNNFVARPEGIATFGAAYLLGSEDIAPFVTTDAVLHGLRVTLEEAYRELERDHMIPALGRLLGEMSRSLGAQLDIGQSSALASDLGRLLAVVQTAGALLDPAAEIDPRIRSAVEQELARINAASGSQPSAILPSQQIDYRQFAPRGHYTLNEEFRGYYKARTWLSHVSFELRGAGGDIDVSDARMAVLLARTMDLLAEQGDFRTLYASITGPLAFFNGDVTQDLTWDMLAGSIRSYYGTLGFANVASFADDAMLREFVPYLERNLPAGVRGSQTGFRLIGRSADPGVAIAETVRRSSESARTSDGLQLMSALGSERAARITGEKSARAAATLANRAVEERVQSLRSSMLYTVEPLLQTPGGATNYPGGYPRFMRNEGWRDRELGAALGAWADYQSPILTLAIGRSSTGTAPTRSAVDDEAAGYVEPNPEAWSRVASFAGYLRTGFSQGNYSMYISRAVLEKLQDIENASAQLMRIAALQLDASPLDREQLAFIASMGRRIAAYETFIDKSLKGDGVVLGATVANDGPAANAHPLALYVVVPRNDGKHGLMLTRGAVYNYQETDASAEDWIRQITATGAQFTPDTRRMQSYVDPSAAMAQSLSELRAVEATIPSVASYDLTDKERKRILPTMELSFESNVARRSSGELWYTLDARKLSGTTVYLTVINSGGQVVYQSQPERIEGARQDLIPVNDLPPGQYFIRVIDLGNRTLASGRFLVVQ